MGGIDDPWGHQIDIDLSDSSECEVDGYSSDDSDSSIDSARMAELQRLDDESDGNDSDSDDQSDDDVVIRTGDERVPIPTSVLIEHRRAYVYAPETLMRLIPDSDEFDKVREDLRIQKTEYKYSLQTSNKRFEREYYLRHNVPCPKSLKRLKVVYKGDELDRFYGSKHPFSKRVIFRPVRRKPIRRRAVKKVVKPSVQEITDFLTQKCEPTRPLVREQFVPKRENPAQISKIIFDKKETYVSELGGISYKLRPSRKIDAIKWYRMRKGQPFFYNTFGVMRAYARECSERYNLPYD